MKKAIFFSNQPHDVNRVYSHTARERIGQYYDIGDVVYGATDVGDKDFTCVEAIFSTWGMPVLTEEQIKLYFPALKYVFYAAGSVQYFAQPYLSCGVRIFSAWQANALPVVEYCVSQILLANKGYFQLIGKTRESYSASAEYFHRYIGNYGAKVGILGDGTIGSAVIDELLKHKLDVYVFSITMTKAQAEKRGVKLCTLEEIFSECDVISNHLANNGATQGIIGKKLLQSMKDFATFINTGRGAQVDEAGLIEVFANNPTLTALLDVTCPEPPVTGSPLYTLPNVFLTPHIAGSAGREVERMAELMAECCERLSGNEQPSCEVTKKMLEGMA